MILSAEALPASRAISPQRYRTKRAYAVLTVKAVGDDERITSGTATTPTPDRVGDIIEPLGVKFTNPLPLLWQHRSTSRLAGPFETDRRRHCRPPSGDRDAGPVRTGSIRLRGRDQDRSRPRRIYRLPTVRPSYGRWWYPLSSEVLELAGYYSGKCRCDYPDHQFPDPRARFAHRARCEAPALGKSKTKPKAKEPRKMKTTPPPPEAKRAAKSAHDRDHGGGRYRDARCRLKTNMTAFGRG